ncbi:MAG: B12-binding domain-containing radical SAM protein [Candidatus Krumholzibacteriota bacterium]|nr:B12-binding domain-containing radical SAM protein [Candidatus Krumholzibacteriota bacterium]
MIFKHALALYPYFRDSTATMGVFPPTGLEYIVTNMKDLAGKVTLLDLRYEKEYRDVEVLSDFIKKEIDLLCISITWDSQFKEICDFIGRLPDDVTTVVGGHKATEEVETLLEKCPNIDLIVRGEGEETIREILKGVPSQDIPGLSFRGNGMPVHNQNRSLPDDLGDAYPDRSLRRHDYHWVQNGVKVARFTFDTILTSRGCPYNCKFCTFSLNPLGQKRKYTERSLPSVIDELKKITADVVLFSDDNFFTNPRRSEELCELIIENGIEKKFIVQTRIEIARHPKLLELAQKAGFKILLIGIESPHDRILKQLDKGFNQQQVREAFKILNRYNFYIHGYFIYGNIGETEEEMTYIARFAKELKLDSITFQKLRVEKYSPLKEVVENTPGYHCDSVGGPVYSDRYNLKDLRRIRNGIRKTFYDFGQLFHILKKSYTAEIFSAFDLMYFIAKLPKIMVRLARREFEKKGWLPAP